MTIPSPASRRAFVRRHTRLQEVSEVPGLRLRLADDVTTLWHRTGEFLGLADPPLPYWAFVWSGGLGIVRHLQAHPELVTNRSVVDVGSGSGLCAIVAAGLGAAAVLAIDVDPLAAAALEMNARENRVRIGFNGRDVLDEPPPACDVLLAGDVSYEGPMAERMIEWLRAAASAGTSVLLGDPGRRYLPHGLDRLATYRVRTSREIEEAELTESTVYAVTHLLPDTHPTRGEQQPSAGRGRS